MRTEERERENRFQLSKSFKAEFNFKFSEKIKLADSASRERVSANIKFRVSVLTNFLTNFDQGR